MKQVAKPGDDVPVPVKGIRIVKYLWLHTEIHKVNFDGCAKVPQRYFAV